MPPREGYRALRCGTQGFALGYFRSRLWRDNSYPENHLGNREVDHQACGIDKSGNQRS
jgi:hypothetical protein